VSATVGHRDQNATIYRGLLTRWNDADPSRCRDYFGKQAQQLCWDLSGSEHAQNGFQIIALDIDQGRRNFCC